MLGASLSPPGIQRGRGQALQTHAANLSQKLLVVITAIEHIRGMCLCGCGPHSESPTGDKWVADSADCTNVPHGYQLRALAMTPAIEARITQQVRDRTHHGARCQVFHFCSGLLPATVNNWHIAPTSNLHNVWPSRPWPAHSCL